MQLIFKAEVLIYQLKAKLYVKILFDKITHCLIPEIRKMLVKGLRNITEVPYE